MNLSFGKSKRFWQSIGVTAVLTGSAYLLIPTQDLPIPRDGYGFVAPTATQRMNILLNANVNIPEIVWESETWQNEIRVDPYDRVFLVPVWVRRGGESYWTKVDEARVPAHQFGYLVLSTDQYEFGPDDMIALATHPGLLVTKATPYASVIDRISNDPVTVPRMKVRIEPGVAKKRPVRRGE